MTKELAVLMGQNVQKMVDESMSQLMMGANHGTVFSNFSLHDRAIISVMKQHIAVLEGRQASLRNISLAISDALGELWWSVGTDAKKKIERVRELAQEIRNEDAIPVEPVIPAKSTRP